MAFALVSMHTTYRKSHHSTLIRNANVPFITQNNEIVLGVYYTLHHNMSICKATQCTHINTHLVKVYIFDNQKCSKKQQLQGFQLKR